MYVPGLPARGTLDQTYASCTPMRQTPEDSRYLYGIVKALVVLNLMDAVFTLFWIQVGLAEEANAFMRDLVVQNALAFVMAKIALVSLGSALLWRLRHHRLAVTALMGSFVAYLVVVLYHLRFSGVLLLGDV